MTKDTKPDLYGPTVPLGRAPCVPIVFPDPDGKNECAAAKALCKSYKIQLLEAKLKTIEAIMDKFSKAEINEMFFGYFPKAEIEQRNGGDYYGDTNVDEPIFFDGVKAMNYIGSHCCVGDWMMRKLITETLAGRFKL